MTNPEQFDSKVGIQELYELVHKQSSTINSLKKQLSTQIEKKILNSTKQLEASQALQGLIGDTTGRLGCLNGYLLSPEHGFPVSPDFAVNLVRLIRDRKYDLTIEFGSGTSTLLCLKAFETFNLFPKEGAESSPRLITFEHLEEYHQKTSRLVANCPNRSLLDLRLSLLMPWNEAKNNFSYYSNTSLISEAINALGANANAPIKVLVIIDGPPGNTCHWARYPAVPIVLDAASGTDISIDFLLDDMIRTDEKEMAIAWEELIKAFGLSYERIDYNFEKGGMLLTLNSLERSNTSLLHSEALTSEKQEQEAIASAITQVDELLAELEQVKQVASSEKSKAQQAVDELKQQLEAQGGELQMVIDERDAQVKEKGEAQQAVDELKQQLKAQGGELQMVIDERDAQAQKKQDSQQQLADLSKQLGVTQQQLSEASEEAELTLLQLHRVQEELEQVFLTEQRKEADLESAEQQIESLQNQLKSSQQKLKETTANLIQKSEQAKDSSEEAELTLLQLHKVQEELEHYFLRSRDGDELAAAQQHQLSRAQNLMGRLLPVVAKSHSNVGESTDVITPDVMSESHTSVQTDALLASYQKSLHRAAALLKRALRS